MGQHRLQLNNVKAEFGDRAVQIPSGQHNRWKVLVLHGVREMLGLQAESPTVLVNCPAFAADIGAAQKVASIKLQTRLGGAAVQQDAAG